MNAEDFEKKLLESLEYIILRSAKALSFKEPYAGLFMHKLSIDTAFILSSVLDWDDNQIQDFLKGINEKLGVVYPKE